jgi:hypothetical protein
VHADVHCLGVVGLLWHVLVDDLETDAFGSHKMSDRTESRLSGGQAAHRDVHMVHCLGVVGVLWHVLVDDLAVWGLSKMNNSRKSRTAGAALKLSGKCRDPAVHPC